MSALNGRVAVAAHAPRPASRRLASGSSAPAQFAYAGLLLYCVLLYIRPTDWVPAVLNWPLELILGIAVLLLALLSPRPRFPVQVSFLAAWAAVAFLSNAVNLKLAEGYEFAVLFAKRGVLFVLFWLVLDTLPKLRWLLVLLVVLSAVLGLQGIWMNHYGYGWAGQPMYWGERIRWVGLWDGANVLSLLFVMALPFVLEFIFGPRGMRARLLGIAAGALLLSGLYLAASRGGYVAAAVVFLLYFRRRIGNLGIVVGVAAMLGLVTLGPARFQASDARDESSWRGRVYMWSEGLEMVRYYPTLGIGKGQFLSYTNRQIAHNTFVQNMGETGLIGLFVWVALIYFSYRSLLMLKGLERMLSPPLRAANRAIFVSLTGYLAASMFISTDFEPLYILMALSAVVLRLAQKETGLPLRLRATQSDLIRIAALEVGGISVMYIATATLSRL